MWLSLEKHSNKDLFALYAVAMTTSINYIVFLLFCYSISVITAKIQCMNDENKPVDWFVVYKLPHIKHHSNKLIKNGLGYIYITSEDYNNTWKFSNKSINDSVSIIGNTLSQLYKDNRNDYFYTLYNDQPPEERSKSNKGHNKGVILTDNDEGLWLIHSVPHFPVLLRNYIFPRTGTVYGQSFLCLSLDLENLNQIGLQLQYNEPEIYAYNLINNSSIKSKIPQLIDAALNITVNSPPWFHQVNLMTKNGFNVNSFAKSNKFNKDLYEDWVAPALQSSLFVETWGNGAGGRLSSNCTKQFKVNNIKSITIEIVNATFASTTDHSKWAVSSSTSNFTHNWVCIGDINRMEHQKYRGGGTVCLKNKMLTKNYQKCIANIEQCKKTEN